MRTRLGTVTAGDRPPLGRWCAALVAVPLAAGGPNSACEADTPPPGAQAEGHPDGADKDERDDSDDRNGSAKEAKEDEEKNDHDDDAATRDILCIVSADAPTVDDEGVIVGTARYWCESPGVDQLTVIVRVQRRGGDGTWITVATSRDTLGGRQTVRVEGDSEPMGWAQTACSTGTFRTVVVAKRAAGGDVEVVVDNSFQATDPCDLG